MNDMRRTILWVVFSVSLVLLWDAWQKHNGHPSMFGIMFRDRLPESWRAAAEVSLAIWPSVRLSLKAGI